ncbi:UDP-3-O-(3-hydroxymyristoyl)glucosamine N-acyltransferase [Flavobacterium sp.]|jgi:UDP-3-O-[3-hydroxymyristoyl] glucosamine N-acyltransferase|uniref:UDP-3-O-(3-hydroxymyristoyl)glucosamine N-acyltransferase n=1 Tax=Flavobacterium sp. TaxID=239 RepID=UPI0022C4AA55|nr:UDP-3-O-(3-hydroxymyristoyl)glucosamine N-acyltransferase [Flavobacterium sp.]MCZ8228434.1 UDP-3-O-(3-hydroxymyristoyl)glucosamine N-acyltransferase [Flavobacterium sp.]
MKFTAEQIAGILEGEVVGNPSASVSRLSKIEEGTEGSLTFLSNPKYLNYIYSTQASITIVNDTFEPESPITTTLIKVKDAYASFTKLLEFYNEVKRNKSGIEQPSVISDAVKYGANLYLGSFSYIGQNVVIGDNVKIYPNCFIGDNVVIGNNVTIFAGVNIYSETVIGNDCVIHSGVVLGSDGFGFVPKPDGTFDKIPQIGNVVLEDGVEVGANTTIDRATLGSTIIRRGVKLDNQIQIAHNVEIGENTVIAAQTGIAGSSKVGKNAMLGGQVGVVGHLTIGDNVRIQAQSGVTRNIKDDETIQGTPAFTYNDFNKSYIYFKKLPQLVAELEELKKIINQKHGNNG